MRRAFFIDDYNTWYDWDLTLTAKDTPTPEPKTNYVELGGVSGSLDLTEALQGEVAYSDRTVTASFWTSEGDYSYRDAIVKQVVSLTHGKKVKIVEPDDPDHYFLGRIMVKNITRSQVHMAFDIEAICEPWRYALEETECRVRGGETIQIWNEGVKTLCPELEVEGSVTLTYEGDKVNLTAGRYRIAGLRLRQGENMVSVSGSGSVTFIYREATL